jgi:hypothetical protein
VRGLLAAARPWQCVWTAPVQVAEHYDEQHDADCDEPSHAPRVTPNVSEIQVEPTGDLEL